MPLPSHTTPRSSQRETRQISLHILDMIPKVGKISARDIHQRLVALGYERNQRSIQRHLKALSAQFDIEKDESSKPYGYKWKANSVGLSIPGLTAQESLLLRLAEEYLKNLLPPSLLKAMSGFFAQARGNLGPAEVKAQTERRWLKKVRVISTDQPLLPPELASGVLDAVGTALYRETWLEIDYANAAGKRGIYRVMPLGLAQQGARLVLVVRYDGHSNERSLAVNRIIAARDTSLPFEYPNDFELSRYEDDGRFGLGEGDNVVIRFSLPKLKGEYLTESRLSHDQTVVERADGRYEFTATVKHTEQLIWWLRGFGSDLEVISPPAVANAL